MYKLDYSNIKKEKIIFIPFITIGIILLIIFGIIMFSAPINKKKMDSKVEAYKVEINSHRNSDGDLLYKPTYYYIVDRVVYTYTPSYSTNIGISKMNNDKTIYYNSLNPYDCVASYEATIDPIFISVILFICIFPLIGIIGIIKINKKIKKLKLLAKNGTLIKNLKYTLVPSNLYADNSPLMAIQVSYELPSGSVIQLISNLRFDRKLSDQDGLVDLLIDKNNTDNYYIDFSIKSENDFDDFHDFDNNVIQ